MFLPSVQRVRKRFFPLEERENKHVLEHALEHVFEHVLEYLGGRLCKKTI